MDLHIPSWKIVAYYTMRIITLKVLILLLETYADLKTYPFSVLRLVLFVWMISAYGNILFHVIYMLTQPLVRIMRSSTAQLQSDVRNWLVRCGRLCFPEGRLEPVHMRVPMVMFTVFVVLPSTFACRNEEFFSYLVMLFFPMVFFLFELTNRVVLWMHFPVNLHFSVLLHFVGSFFVLKGYDNLGTALVVIGLFFDARLPRFIENRVSWIRVNWPTVAMEVVALG